MRWAVLAGLLLMRVGLVFWWTALGISVASVLIGLWNAGELVNGRFDTDCLAIGTGVGAVV